MAMTKKLNLDKLDRYLENVPKDRTPGINMAVYKDGEIVFRKCYGTDDKDMKHKTQPDTAYTLFSMTKLFTTGAAMQLIEKGKLKLNDPVAKYLPAYENMTVQTRYGVRPARTVLRVKHLMAMQGGFDYNLGTPEIRKVVEETNGHATTRQVIDALAKKPLCFDPGTHFQYSLCHDVLAVVIEVASGMRFEEYLRKNIWQPLGIVNASMHKDTYPEKEKLAEIWTNTPSDPTLKASGTHNVFVVSDRYESGGAGLIATCDEYMKYAATIANGGVSPFTGARLFKKETIDLWHKDRQLSKACYEDFQRCKPLYGYGLGVRTNITKGNGSAPIGEFGWDGAAGSYVMLDTDYNVAAVYMQSVCNSAYDCGNMHHDIRDIIFDAIYAAE